MMAYWTGSTDVLEADGEFIGPTRYSERHDHVIGSVYASHTGTLYIEQSPDGENWDISTENTVAADTGEGFSEDLRLPFWRIRYVNDSTEQTAFRVSARTGAGGDS